jgi:hypothetical protein
MAKNGEKKDEVKVEPSRLQRLQARFKGVIGGKKGTPIGKAFGKSRFDVSGRD